MLRDEAGNEVVNLALTPGDRHALILGEYKANVKSEADSRLAVMAAR